MSLTTEAYRQLDGIELARRIRSGHTSPEEVHRAFEHALEAARGLNAVSAVADPSIRTADAQGAFAGVPIAAKELLAVPGLPWTMGSRLMRTNPAPGASAYVEALLGSGARIVASATASEFGLLGSTETLLHGVTHNPWSTRHSAGGSSGGSAALVAAGVVPMAHANDAGGSIRGPASMNGLFGFMPSRGRCAPAGPAEGLSALVIEHVLTRTVRDSQAMLQATLRRDAEAPWAPMPEVHAPAPKRLRIAAWHTTLIGPAAAPAVRAAWQRTVEACACMGHDVHIVEAPKVDGRALSDAFFTVAAQTMQGVMAMFEPMLGRMPGPEELEPFTLELARWGSTLGPDAGETCAATFKEAAATHNKIFEHFDVTLTPTLATPAWALGHLAPTLDRQTLISRTEQAVGFTPIHNVAGCPAMSVPLEMHEGLPIGMHFAAPPGEDARLFALAYELEAELPWKHRYAEVQAWPKS